jgi:hypothetical protein
MRLFRAPGGNSVNRQASGRQGHAFGERVVVCLPAAARKGCHGLVCGVGVQEARDRDTQPEQDGHADGDAGIAIAFAQLPIDGAPVRAKEIQPFELQLPTLGYSVTSVKGAPGASPKVKRRDPSNQESVSSAEKRLVRVRAGCPSTR